MYLSGAIFKNICSENFLHIIIKVPVAEFIFKKISCCQHILLNTFRWILLNYENCSFRNILFQTLKQYSDYKSFIAKPFDGNTLKMKAVSTIQVIKNKKAMLLVVPRLNVLFGFEHPFFSCPDNRAPIKKFVYPCLLE